MLILTRRYVANIYNILLAQLESVIYDEAFVKFLSKHNEVSYFNYVSKSYIEILLKLHMLACPNVISIYHYATTWVEGAYSKSTIKYCNSQHQRACILVFPFYIAMTTQMVSSKS